MNVLYHEISHLCHSVVGTPRVQIIENSSSEAEGGWEYPLKKEYDTILSWICFASPEHNLCTH